VTGFSVFSFLKYILTVWQWNYTLEAMSCVTCELLETEISSFYALSVVQINDFV
jgi:hypothetical protein